MTQSETTNTTHAGLGAGRLPGLSMLFLFFAAFAVFAIWPAWSLVMQLVAWWQVQDWMENPCVIQSAELKFDNLGESETCFVSARYRYTHGEREYSGDRVWLRNEYGEEDDARTILRELSSYIGGDQKFRCFVNPANPSDAVLYRSLRPQLLLMKGVFVFVFGGAGVGGLCLLVAAQRRYRDCSELAVRYPDEPWKWDQDFHDGHIPPNAEWKAWTAFAFVWNISTVLPLMSAFPRFNDGGAWVYLLLVFPSLGLWLIVTAGLLVYHRLKYGKPPVTMRPWPYHVGEMMRLQLEFPTAVPQSREFRAVLTVSRVVQAENESTCLFAVTEYAENVGRIIQFEFPIPSGLPRSHQVKGTSCVDTARWLLTVTSSDCRWGFRSVYVLPVF